MDKFIGIFMLQRLIFGRGLILFIIGFSTWFYWPQIISGKAFDVKNLITEPDFSVPVEISPGSR